MAVFKCKMCGGTIEFNAGDAVGVCDSCGTKQTLPKSDDDAVNSLFNRANTLRLKSEFDRAADIYNKIISVDEAQAEAYWGLILCKYGIEYVEDPKTFKRVPTCHRTSFESITADEDYRLALKYGDSAQKMLYEAEARTIDVIQKDILKIAVDEKPFDVFLCYKETDKNGRRTQDSVTANEIYHQLTQEGYKVFYAAITLEDKLGQKYEPYIFAALNSANVMLVIGSRPEYFTAVWVKNEWSRFLKLMKNDRSKLLIPCYKDIDAYELPDDFAHLQAQDMSKIGFINDVVRGIKKVVNKETETPKVKETVVVSDTQTNANIVALKKRGFMALEDGEWQKADGFFEEALNQDAEDAECYLGKLMVELQVDKEENLRNCAEPFDDNNYQKAVHFGNNDLPKYIAHINERSEAYKIRIDNIAKAILNHYNSSSYKNREEHANLYTDTAISFEDAEKEMESDETLKKDVLALISIMSMRYAEVGDLVNFGKYRQESNSNDSMPIEWLVLAKENNKILVISDKALDCQQYDTSYTDVTWETCSLRKWMNGTFLNNAFSAAEQAQIQNTNVSADKNPGCSTNPGNATTDKVFLLSITEAEKYFSSDSARQCKPTKYAIANGAYVNSDNGNCWWWLRSPGDSQDGAALVYDDGPVGYIGHNVDLDDDCVRPALWINLES